MRKVVMGYRFLKFTSSYPDFVNRFIESNQDYDSLSYRVFFNRYTNEYNGINHGKYLEKLGNITQFYNVSIKQLQLQWAKENGIKYTEKNWQKEIIIAQIQQFEPDIIYLEDLYFFDEKLRQEIRDIVHKTTKIIGWRSAPTLDFSRFRDIDLILTGAPNFVEIMSKFKINAYYLPLAFDESILGKIPPLKRDLDFTFLGSVGSSEGPFKNRYNLLKQLYRKTPIEIWGDKNDWNLHALDISFFNPNNPTGISQRRVDIIMKNPLIPKEVIQNGIMLLRKRKYYLFSNKKNSDRIHNSIFGIQYFKILARSKLTFNCHIDCSENYAGNMRLFEATGMGAGLITDWKENISDFFKPDAEIITYRNAKECIDKITYYLKNDDEREAIAKAGQNRTLNEHTYEKRIIKLNMLINELL
jgi:spore maturation protein CgeB